MPAERLRINRSREDGAKNLVAVPEVTELYTHHIAWRAVQCMLDRRRLRRSTYLL